MGFLEEKCTFQTFNFSSKFCCGYDDLDEFFEKDCINYSNELMGKTYCFTVDDTKEVATAFTISNDSIKASLLPNARRKKVSERIPRAKQVKSYPAVLIGRLGVSSTMKRKGIGTELMNFIKAWFIRADNKTGCRFVVVDAYNEDEPIEYYKSNGFGFLFTTEEQEKAYTGITDPGKLRTRLMYFDLILLRA